MLRRCHGDPYVVADRDGPEAGVGVAPVATFPKCVGGYDGSYAMKGDARAADFGCHCCAD